MKSRGVTTWFAVDSMIHTSPKVVELAALLKLDIDTTVGKLARLWAFAKLARSEDGKLGKLPDEEIAGIMRWNKKPKQLVDALVASRLIDRNASGELAIHGWYEMNGKAVESVRKDNERHAGNSAEIPRKI